MNKTAKTDKLLEKLMERINAAPPADPPRPVESRLVRSDDRPPSKMCEIERESHCRMIRHFRRRWGYPMQVIIDQACFGLAGMEQLDDDALIQLHKDVERAQECMRDGVSFEDAGLLRSRYG